MKNSITDITTLLNGLEGVQTIAAHKRQLHKDTTDAEAPLPSVLVDIEAITFNDLAHDLSQTPSQQQLGMYQFVITVAEGTSTTTSYNIWETIESIHNRLQGVRLGETYGKLLRTNLNRVALNNDLSQIREDAARIYEITYTCDQQGV